MAAFAVGIGGLVASVGLSQTATAQVSARLTAAALDEVVVNLPADDGLLDPDDDRLTRWSTDLAALPHVQAAGHLAEISPADARITRSAPDEPEPAAALTLASASASYAAAADLRFPAGSEAVLESAAERAAWVTPDAARALHLPAPDSGVLSPGYRIWVEGQSVPVLGLVRVSERTPQLGAAVFVSLIALFAAGMIHGATITGAAATRRRPPRPVWPVALALVGLAITATAAGFGA